MTEPVRKKLPAEAVIAATVASLRHTTDKARDIAKAIVRHLNFFGYEIRPSGDRPTDKAEPRGRER